MKRARAAAWPPAPAGIHPAPSISGGSPKQFEEGSAHASGIVAAGFLGGWPGALFWDGSSGISSARGVWLARHIT